MSYEPLLRRLYADFNARNVDAVLAMLAPDVDWPNGWEGGWVKGREEVRRYWARQWGQIDTRAEPVAVTEQPGGRVVVDVDQSARTLDGEPLGEQRVQHVYEFRDGLVARMDIVEPGN